MSAYEFKFGRPYTPPGNPVEFRFGVQTIEPTGFDAATFGTARIVMTVLPTGFNSQQFGTATITAAIHPFSFDLGALVFGRFGNNTIENKNRTITLNGSSFAVVGTNTRVKARFVADTFATDEYGTPTFTQTAPTIHPTGFNALTFGAATVSNFTPSIVTVGWNSLEISHFNMVDFRVRTIAPTTFDDSDVPPAFISHRIRTVFPTSFDDELFRPFNSIENRNRTIAVPAFIATRFGTQFISNFNRTIFPTGFDSLETTRFNNVGLYTRYIFPVGKDMATVWGDFGPINPLTGRAASIIGAQRVDADAFEPLEFGTASVQYTGGNTIGARGFDASSIGEHAIA